MRGRLDPAAEAEQKRRDQEPAKGVIVAHRLPGIAEARRSLASDGLRLGHGEPPQTEARGHAQKGRCDEDPAVADSIEELARGQGKPDPQHCARHADQAESAGTLSARIDSLDDRGLCRRHGGAEEIPGDHEADERPRRAHERHQEKDTARHERRPDQIRQRRPPMGHPRPQQRQEQACAARRGHHGELQWGGAEVAPQDQTEERSGQRGEDREQECRRDVDAEGAASLRAESRSDHLRPSGLAETAGRSPNTVPRTIMSYPRVTASLRDDAG